MTFLTNAPTHTVIGPVIIVGAFTFMGLVLLGVLVALTALHFARRDRGDA